MYRHLVTIAWFMMAIFVGACHASERATAPDAVAMVRKVVAQIKLDGKENVIAAINAGATQFRDRDLYVSITDLHARSLANGANRKLVGKDLLGLKDADGKEFMKERLNMLKSSPTGWIEYKWPNLETGTIERKSLYFEQVGDVVVSCGIYRK